MISNTGISLVHTARVGHLSCPRCNCNAKK